MTTCYHIIGQQLEIQDTGELFNVTGYSGAGASLLSLIALLQFIKTMNWTEFNRNPKSKKFTNSVQVRKFAPHQQPYSCSIQLTIFSFQSFRISHKFASVKLKLT